MAYYSLPDEVNTHQLLDELVAEGKTVLLPKVLDATTMELRLYTGPHDLAPGPFGILEPSGSQYSPSSFLFPPSSKTSSIDVALIPGIAFSSAQWGLSPVCVRAYSASVSTSRKSPPSPSIPPTFPSIK